MKNSSEFDRFEAVLTPYLKENNLDLSSNVIFKLFQYYEITQDWGRKMNVTRNLEIKDYICENILDPVLSYMVFCQNAENISSFDQIIDFGTGGGYVGVTWKILYDDQKQSDQKTNVNQEKKLKFSYVDSVRKKISFVDKAIRSLELADSVAIHNRAESYDFSQQQSYLIVSRATWSWKDYIKIFKDRIPKTSQILSFEGLATEQEPSPDLELSYTILPFVIKRNLWTLNAK